MKRMKKKVVAMVTLAMFMLTLVPMAAFAANTDPDAQTSVFKTVEENPTVTVKEKVDAKFVVKAVDPTQTATAFSNMTIWATDEQGRVTSAMLVDGKSATPEGSGNVYSIGQTDNKTELKLSFTRAGKYTLHAGAAANYEDAKKAELLCDSVVTVDPVELAVKTLQVNGAENQTDNSGLVDFSADATPGQVANGVNALAVEATITTVVAGTDNPATAEGQKVTIEAPANFVVKDAKDKAVTEMTTDDQGKVNFNLIPSSAVGNGYYPVTLTAGDFVYTLSVKVGNVDSSIKTLEVVPTDATVVGTTASSSALKLDNVAQFVAKNAKGEVVPTTTKPGVSVVTTDYPKNGKVNFTVEAYKDNKWTLQVANGSTLKEGTYTVLVALQNEQSSVEFTFDVKKFGKAVDIVFDKVTEAKGTEVSNDEVLVGGTYSGKVLLVDANGVTSEAKTATIGVSGVAADLIQKTAPNFGFNVKAKNADNESTVGSKITVTVYDDTVKKNIKKEFTVVESQDANTLAFDSESGKVQVPNTVKVTLVDEKGNLVKENATGAFKFYVVSNSNQDANIYVANKTDLADGEGSLTVSADKATTAEIVVYAQVGDQVFGNTLKYTFGEESIPADTSVVMTLGSTEMVINNNIVDMKDAAPFAQNNRTFVPFRALGEALGATVNYVEADKTVTYTLGSTEIVMTLDSKTYTVNGAEKTMDVAPFAKDGRTYVPVRFVGEALGFTVNALQNSAGEYVTVVFTK